MHERLLLKNIKTSHWPQTFEWYNVGYIISSLFQIFFKNTFIKQIFLQKWNEKIYKIGSFFCGGPRFNV